MTALIALFDLVTYTSPFPKKAVLRRLAGARNCVAEMCN
jgi:hypothetical protein